MAARIQASPACSSSSRSREGSPRVMMTTMPASEISMPVICLAVARSRSISQEQAIMNSGADELSSTALIAVVVRRPWYTIVWNNGTLRSASSASIPACRRSTSPLPATARNPKGVSTTSAMNQRQKLRLTGSNVSRSARPSTQLPAHSRLVSARSENAASCELEARSVRLLIGVIRGAHERPDGGVPEAQFGSACLVQSETRGIGVPLDRQMMRRRLQVLADGQHVDVVRAKVAHHVEDLGVGLAQTDHEPRLRGNGRVAPLELLQQRERVPVIPAGPCLFIEARYRLQVVIHDVGWCGREDLERAVQAAAEIGNQNFDGRARTVLPDGTDAIDEVLGAAVAQVVAIHAGDHYVAKRELGDRFRQVAGLVRIRRERPAVRHIAEGAAPRADVAEDHEGGGALAEALGDVRAGRLFADRVQLLAAKDVLDFAEARIRAWRPHADPRRLGQRRAARHDADRLRLSFFLYARFTHARDARLRSLPAARPWRQRLRRSRDRASA